MSKKEAIAIENLYNRSKKLFERLNQPSLFEEPLKDSIIVANISKDIEKENNNIKSLDTLDKAELLDYSIKPNGNLDNSRLKDSISNTYLESSENGSVQKGGFITSEGKMVRLAITKYKALVLKYGKIIFINNGFMNESFVQNNDILYLESKIPVFKANNFGEILHDTLRNYHQQGSDKEDKNNLININQTNTHKINLDESNFAAIADSKIYIFLHKVTQENFRQKKDGKKKDISSAQSTEIIQNHDTILGYSSLEMNKIFLSDDFKFQGNINLVQKDLSNKKREKSSGKKSTSNINKKNKNKSENQFDEKGERIIGNIEIAAYLKRPRDKIFKEDKKVNQLTNSINKMPNVNNDAENNNLNKNNNQSPMKEFIIGQPPVFNNNLINEENNNEDDVKLNEQSQNGEEKLMVDDGMEKIRTDINGDILILYLKINELKSSNDMYNPENSINNNINEQINNLDKNKNIIFYNYTGPQLPRHNFFLRHKIFPDNKDANSEIIWNKISPNFNYTIQMPFTLNQKTVELMDNGKFLVEIWTKDDNNNSCLGFVSFDLRNVLDSLKVNENTITTLQLYKNNYPYIIYDDYYPVTQINENPIMGTIFLKVCMGIGTPSQVNNFNNLLKKIQNQTKPQNLNMNNQINGMNNVGNMNINKNINNNEVNNQNEKNNMSLDPFKEDLKDDDKDDLNQNNQSNISKAAEINVDQIFEKNKKNMEFNNINNNINISKESLKKSESFEEQKSHQSNKKKIMNPFLVPQNYEKENEKNKISIKETAKFSKLINNDTNNFDSQKNNFNFEQSGRYNNQGTFKNDYNNDLNNYNKNINYNEKKEENIDYNINITNKNINENYNKPNEDINNNINKYNNLDFNINKEDKFNYLNDFNQSNKKEEEQIEENIQIEKEEQKESENNNNVNIEEDNNKIKNDINIEEKENNMDINFNENNEEINEDNNKNKLNLDNEEDKNIEKKNDKNINIINLDNMNKELNENLSSFVKKHIFTISIEKIINCQILSKLPSAYLRYQFFTDQKPLRSEFFTFSQYALDSSVIDVDMKSMHSIILPKVEKIKDYLNDFLVEFLYDLPQKKNSSVIIGRVNIPSDEFASLIGEKDLEKNKNEMSRVLFIYGTEKIQRNKCIIGKLKLSFKYTNIDVPINPNNLLLNGSMMNSLNNNINNSLGPNFAGSIYLEKETIFNRKIPKNAVLKINVEKFNSTPLFEDYFRNQFSIYFIFSIFGEVSKMENQYGKRATSKKHNLLNCEFGETLSYKLEIDQDIIDYLKCRNGIVYLVYKISKNKNIKENNEEIYSLSDKEDINLIEFENTISKNKKIIGKGVFNLNEILTSADTNYKEISIAQIGNGSMSLGVLNISLNLENDNSGFNEETATNKKGLSNTTSELYKLHNLSFNKCDPSLYLNGKFLFSINFTKFYYEINSDLGGIINNSNYFYFVFKLGNKIKKISPKFNQENNELFSLNINSNLLLINYVEMIELNLNFNKKLPIDLYNLFNEGILEIKLFQNENANSLGSFYVDLHKLIVSEFFSENVLYSGNNVLNLVNVNNNTYKNCKIEVNLAIFKLNEMQVNNELVNKINYLNNNLRKESGNMNEISNQENSMSNLDYCEYYQNIFVKDFTDFIIQGLFFNNNNDSNKDKDKEENINIININDENIFNLERIKKVINYNNIDMFNFINNNIINLVDNKGEINIYNFKKIFSLITKLNLDVLDFYFSSIMKPENSNINFTSNTFDYYLSSRVINLDNDDANIINYLKDKQNKIDIGINSNSVLNQNNNKTMKKLLTNNYNYGFNQTNDYIDVVSLCLFIFDYYYNLNNEILFNVLKIKNSSYNNMINDNNNTYSKTQPLIYKKEPQYFNHTTYNMNTMNLNDINKNLNKKPESKIMLISVLSGHNIIKPNSDFTSRPNCYFVLEFDDKNYTSDVVMNTSQPNFNEELEIKINAEEYLQKLNGLNVYISIFSFVDENNSILIGKCEINPAKMFPFLNENNECEDFFHIIGEQGQVMGQLDLKFKFEKLEINNEYRYLINNNESSLVKKKNNNTISYPLNNVFEKNKTKKNFMKTGNEADLLHKKLEEAMNTIDDLTQILKNKVEKENKENNNINNNEEEMINDENGDYNGEEEIINEQQYNEEEIEGGYEEQIINEENQFEENQYEENNNIIDNGNNNINNNEYEKKIALTDYNVLNNSQKMSINGEENDKASFYSDTKEKDKKMKYLKNYDKNLLNKIQKIMKNKK